MMSRNRLIWKNSSQCSANAYIYHMSRYKLNHNWGMITFLSGGWGKGVGNSGERGKDRSKISWGLKGGAKVGKTVGIP